MMKYAEVAVDAPAGYDRTFTYSIPAGLTISPGHLVQVPFGPRVLPGVVFGLSNESPVPETRDVTSTSRDQPILSLDHLALARWISDYYMAPLFECAALMMPPGIRERSLSYYSLTQRTSGQRLSPPQRRVMDYLASRTRVERGALLRALDPRIDSALVSLVRRGFIQVSSEWRNPTVRPRYAIHLELAPSADADEKEAILKRLSPRQASFLGYMEEQDGPVLRAAAVREFGASVVGGLETKDLVRRVDVRLDRDPLRGRVFPPDDPPVLTPDQQGCVSAIESAIDGPSSHVFLLHGVTGSGKTEVYLRSLAHAISRGKRGIVMAPELSLTPQTIDRFSRRFPGQVAVQHSGLSAGERFDQWWRIKEGDYGVTIGARSAVFAPQPDLGLIVIDEEHEPTYKQDDAPRYHAREAALKLADLTGAVVVLGTATPDVVTYTRAVNGRYRLLKLPDRIAAVAGARSSGAGSQPSVQVVDLRRELEEGNRSIFSRALSRGIGRAVEAGEQVILYLNRRGSGSMVQCRDCGHVMRCSRCEFTLTHHAQAGKLLCHRCNYRRNPPGQCPKCRSRQIRYLGLGTQRVVEELQKDYPDIKALRWDRDSTSAKGSHERIMEGFLRGDAQVLVGTQMIAKGLHFPNVTLVGVLCADIGLFLPDFHAGERVFQLLCQVAGRTGRGPLGGQVVVQTYSPNHYAVTAASAQDYAAFYDDEMTYRREHALPPFARLIRLVYTDISQAICNREATRMGDALKRQRDAWGLTDTDILGPAPAFPPRLRGRYRWHIILRGQDPRSLLEKAQIPPGWSVDVDPISVA